MCQDRQPAKHQRRRSSDDIVQKQPKPLNGHPPQNHEHDGPPASITPSPTMSQTLRSPPRALFLASLGNPPPKYHNTLHSAGHILLRALAEHLSAPPFSPNNTLASGLVTETTLPRSNTRLTLWQSPTLMNVSGPALLRAYKTWKVQNGLGSDEQGRALNLVLLQDELDRLPGKLHLRKGGAELSHRGHNGVKSVVGSLLKAGILAPVNAKAGKTAGGSPALVRIGVGIGRPTSRDPKVVADYVLGKMSGQQLERTNALADPLVAMLEKEVVKLL